MGSYLHRGIRRSCHFEIGDQMQQIYPWLILALFALLVIGVFFFLGKSLWKDKEMFFTSWRKMTSFEKSCLKSGFLLYITLPLLKEHPSKDSYITKVSIEIFTAIAGALFVLGVLAFLKYAHEQNESNNQ